MLTIIACIGPNLELGAKNRIPWHISNDMKSFRLNTLDKYCLVGYNTYLSLPTINNQKLPKRKLIVITRRKDIKRVDNVEKVFTLEEFLKWYEEHKQEEIMICGGETIYEQLLSHTDKILLTVTKESCPEADTFFPAEYKNLKFDLISQFTTEECNFFTYLRKNP